MNELHKLREVETSLKNVMLTLGMDYKSEQNLDTPARWAEWLAEFAPKFGPVPNITAFPNTKKYDEMVYDRVEIFSVCSHHILPFIGTAHIAYVPAKLVLGLSKLSRIADYFARQPTMQEELTKTIADYIDDLIKPHGVAVLIQAKHLCKSMRGISKQTGMMVTTDLRGVLREPAPRSEFLTYVRMKEI